MRLHVIVHRVKGGGYWAEVPALGGCFTQAETMDALRANSIEAIGGCLELSKAEIKRIRCHRILEAEVEIRFRKGVGSASGKRGLATQAHTGKPSCFRTPGYVRPGCGSGSRQ